MNEAAMTAVVDDYQKQLPDGCKERASWEQFMLKTFAIYRERWLKNRSAKPAVDHDAPYGE